MRKERQPIPEPIRDTSKVHHSNSHLARLSEEGFEKEELFTKNLVNAILEIWKG